MKCSTVQVSAIFLSFVSLVQSRLVLKGSTRKLDDGSKILNFTCSPHGIEVTHYTEFLVNNKSTASLIFNVETGKCIFKHEETNCINICKCSFDGKSFSWNFPLPSFPVETLYSCHMFIGNQDKPKQASVLFNGTEFVMRKDEEDSSFNSILTTTGKHTIGNEEKEVADQTSNTGLYIVMALVLVVLILVIVFLFIKEVWKRKKAGRKRSKLSVRSHNDSMDENSLRDTHIFTEDEKSGLEPLLKEKKLKQADTASKKDKAQYDEEQRVNSATSESEVRFQDLRQGSGSTLTSKLTQTYSSPL